MGQVLHGSATTTEAVRRAIQESQESVRALARRYGISPTTVQKWRNRQTVSDARMGPKQPRPPHVRRNGCAVPVTRPSGMGPGPPRHFFCAARIGPVEQVDLIEILSAR